MSAVRTAEPSQTPICFDAEETALFGDRTVFRRKARISDKIRGILEQVHEGIRDEYRGTTLLTPAGFDARRVQFVKGEHLEDHPYQYLDFPKHFQGDTKFTFRSLVWWGHYVVFAWLLEGEQLPSYKRNVLTRYHELAGHGLELSLAPSLWDWKRGEGYTLPFEPDRRSQVAAVLERRPCMKVARVVLPEDAALREGRLPEIGRAAFRAMLPIVQAERG